MLTSKHNESLERLSSNYSSWIYLGNQDSEIIIPKCNEIFITVHQHGSDGAWVNRGTAIYPYFIFNKTFNIDMSCSNTDRDSFNFNYETKKLTLNSSTSTYPNFEVYYR